MTAPFSNVTYLEQIRQITSNKKPTGISISHLLVAFCAGALVGIQLYRWQSKIMAEKLKRQTEMKHENLEIASIPSATENFEVRETDPALIEVKNVKFNNES
ncbi:MAG TPA: hypothetical protein VFM18_24460 [Methanosarcina sp.]|nr:hypothetical protein [Methanosarcina sp.]